ncbi:fibulin-2-like isoform X2 [Lepidochelys kempii]|uniref:fibulin-2-like isoform X2 n=1 Tax=Lepidochelys kempii TaxID=8472 RepID=UPI003C701E34
MKTIQEKPRTGMLALPEKMKPEHLLCLLLSCFPLPEAACKPLKPDCTLVKCSPCPDQHTAVTSANTCCAPCAPACSCPDYQQFECAMQGYKDGNVPVGKSFHIDFATQLCTCVSTGNISCTSVCPTVSPTCKETGSPPDGCPQCVCPIDNDRIVIAGSTIPRGPCWDPGTFYHQQGRHSTRGSREERMCLHHLSHHQCQRRRPSRHSF